jgi:hypothetical protein
MCSTHLGGKKCGEYRIIGMGGEKHRGKALSRWLELNERQRIYLEAAYREDQKEEAWQRSAWSWGGRAAPADEWRWILYGSPLIDATPLRTALKTKDLVDAGTGSTFAALADRGLLLTRKAWMQVRLGNRIGDVEVLYVRMTTKGRAAIRAGIEEPPPEGCLPGETKLPVGTLREWHWRALARAYAAGEEGLEEDGGYYGRAGWRTWLRLRDYKNDRDGFGGLVETRRVKFNATGSSDYRLFLTPDGVRFYRERWEEYRKRYPGVEAPQP